MLTNFWNILSGVFFHLWYAITLDFDLCDVRGNNITYPFGDILMLILVSFSSYSRCPLIFRPEVGKIPSRTDKGDLVGTVWSSSVLFRLSGIWETSICPATRSSYCLRTLGRSKCWKRSQCQRINWIAYHRWKILHLKCFKSLWSLNTNLTLNLRTLASWRSWRT